MHTAKASGNSKLQYSQRQGISRNALPIMLPASSCKWGIFKLVQCDIGFRHAQTMALVPIRELPASAFLAFMTVLDARLMARSHGGWKSFTKRIAPLCANGSSKLITGSNDFHSHFRPKQHFEYRFNRQPFATPFGTNTATCDWRRNRRGAR